MPLVCPEYSDIRRGQPVRQYRDMPNQRQEQCQEKSTVTTDARLHNRNARRDTESCTINLRVHSHLAGHLATQPARVSNAKRSTTKPLLILAACGKHFGPDVSTPTHHAKWLPRRSPRQPPLVTRHRYQQSVLPLVVERAPALSIFNVAQTSVACAPVGTAFSVNVV